MEGEGRQGRGRDKKELRCSMYKHKLFRVHGVMMCCKPALIKNLKINPNHISWAGPTTWTDPGTSVPQCGKSFPVYSALGSPPRTILSTWRCGALVPGHRGSRLLWPGQRAACHTLTLRCFPEKRHTHSVACHLQQVCPEPEQKFVCCQPGKSQEPQLRGWEAQRAPRRCGRQGLGQA